MGGWTVSASARPGADRNERGEPGAGRGAARLLSSIRRSLEKSEERLFALRAAARKYKCTVDDTGHDARALRGGTGGAHRWRGKLGQLEKARHAARRRPMMPLPRSCSTVRRQGGQGAGQGGAWPNCRRSSSRRRASKRRSSSGCRKARAAWHRPDRIRGGRQSGTPLSPLMKVASGGELARFMLALKVVLAAKGSAPDADLRRNRYRRRRCGGRCHRRRGWRAWREGLQVLAVTHSPQVAARAGSTC